MKKWIIREHDGRVSAALARECGLPSLCADILAARGIDTAAKARDFFGSAENGGSSPLSDPFLIKDMKEAADIILEAAENGERICIYGDYDCDGVTSTAMLMTYLVSLGADVSYHINMREQGFGMSESAVRELAEKGIQLIITVDNGISAVKEVELAKELGIKVVITDHHRQGEVLPAAEAVVDPHRNGCPSPFKELCGCGVVLKLIAAMEGGDYTMVMEQFSDLAAIATIADSVPITGENREIVRTGLHYLENTENLGLRAIMEHTGLIGKTGIKADDDVSFKIAPLINAAGRMGSAYDAAELLMEEDPESAAERVKALEAQNSERKAVEAAIMEDVERYIREDPSVLYKKVMVLYGADWHHGVVGIAAARLTEKFGKPVFVLHDMNGEVRGSARSVEGFPVHEALDFCGHLLIKHGGHPGAGGFSLKKENIPAFDEALQQYASENFEHMPVYSIYADKVISAAELTVQNIRSLSLLEPFGEGSRTPVFLMRNAEITGTDPLGAGGLHTRFTLNWENKRCSAVMFRQETAKLPYKPGDRLDILAALRTEVYEGKEYIRIYIQDCRCFGISQQRLFNAKEAYEDFRRSGIISPALAKRMIPERTDLEEIYRMIRSYGKIYCDVLFAKLNTERITYCKMKIALDIFEELGFIKLGRSEELAEIIPDAPRASVESSRIYQSLHNGI